MEFTTSCCLQGRRQWSDFGSSSTDWWRVFGSWLTLCPHALPRLASGIFDVEITADAARGFTTALLLLICAWGISKAYYGVTKSPANQPMTVVHLTSKTPAQVVSEDRWGKFKTLVAIGAVLVIVYFFGTAAMR